MRRPAGYLSVVLGGGCLLGATALRRVATGWPAVLGVPTATLAAKGLTALAILLLGYGVYLIASRAVARASGDKRRLHDVRNVLRLAVGVGTVVALFGVVTDQWVGVLFSLGIVGFAVTFALQQPLFSLLGWAYIMVKRPYAVGDRVKIEDAKGDVVEVDFLVTTLWEIDGDLVATNQPSGRVVTVPNSVVLSSQVFNFSREEFPYVWSELAIQVSYETDLAFARETMREVADEYLGDEMERNIDTYRDQLAETPVDLDVSDRPTVNIRQEESWVELRLRYLAHPRRLTAVRNDLYEQVLDRFHEHPDRVSFPVGRFR